MKIRQAVSFAERALLQVHEAATRMRTRVRSVPSGAAFPRLPAAASPPPPTCSELRPAGSSERGRARTCPPRAPGTQVPTVLEDALNWGGGEGGGESSLLFQNDPRLLPFPFEL